MARIKTSAIIADISGKVNGSVFQRNQGGLIMRNQSGKINSNTNRSNLHRVGISSIQGDWQALSDQDRLLWQTYALYLNRKQRRNPTLNVNGHQLFLNINSLRFDLQNISAIFNPYLLSTPVLTPIPQPINILSIERVGATLILNFDRATANFSDVVILYLSRPLRGSEQSGYIKTTLMKVQTDTGTTIECSAYYTEVYGRLLQVGEWVNSKVAIYNSTSENYSSYSIGRFQVQ